MASPFTFREYLTDDLDKVKDNRLEESFINNLRNSGCRNHFGRFTPDS